MKRQYFAYLAEAQGHGEQTIDAVAKAIARFEPIPSGGLQAVSYRAGEGHSSAIPRGPAGLPQRRATEQSHALRHRDRAEAFLCLHRWTTRLRITNFLFGCRILQPFGQGHSYRKGDPSGARADRRDIQGAGETIAFPKKI